MPRPRFTVLLDAPGEPTSRIPIAKLGEYDDPRYGEFKITAQDAADWKANLAKLPGGRALIDEDHLANKPSPHRRTEASGWITDVQLDGEMVYADVEWTPKGRAAIAEKRFLFTSPTYGPHTTSSGEVVENTLTGAALTNKPFLDMPMVTLASADALEQAKAKAKAKKKTKAAKVKAKAKKKAKVKAKARALDQAPANATLLDVSQAERDKAKAEGNSLPDGSYPIRNTDQLRKAAVLAASHHGDWKAAQTLIRRRAKELGVDVTTLPGFGDGKSLEQPTDVAKLLEQPAVELLRGDDHTSLNAIVRLLSAERAISYPDALQLFMDDTQPHGEHASRRSVGDVLGRAKVQSPEDGLRTLQRRDELVQRTLDSALAPVTARPCDEQGRVALEQGFDISAYLHDDERRERDWRRARELKREYADREKWNADQLMFLESGCDLLAGLERPLSIAEARMKAAEVGRQLDQAIEQSRGQAQRARQLDEVIANMRLLEQERADLQPADPFDPGAKPAPVRTLDRPDAGTSPPTFTELTGAKMLEAIECWDEHEHRISLDEAAARVSGYTLDSSIPEVGLPQPDLQKGPRGELDERIKAHCQEHGCDDYQCGLRAVTGVGVGAWNA